MVHSTYFFNQCKLNHSNFKTSFNIGVIIELYGSHFVHVL